MKTKLAPYKRKINMATASVILYGDPAILQNHTFSWVYEKGTRVLLLGASFYSHQCAMHVLMALKFTMEIHDFEFWNKNKLHRKMIERGKFPYLIEGQTLQHKFIHGIKFQVEYIIIIFYLHKKKIHMNTMMKQIKGKHWLCTATQIEHEKSSIMICRQPQWYTHPR